MTAGYFTDQSMLRRVHRERAIALSGPRALLMQAAHPLAVTGLLAHSTAMDEPYDRLARTAETMSTIGFGTREDADRVTAHVREMHTRVKGQDQGAGRRSSPPARPTAPTSPTCCCGCCSRWSTRAWWSTASTWAPCRAPTRPPTGTTTRWSASCSASTRADMPDTLDDLHDYRRDMLEGEVLLVTDWARRRAREIVLEPPIPWVAQPLLQTANFITIALLPDRIRREYGFLPLPPAPVRKAVVAGGAEYVKRALIPFLPDRLRLVPAARAA